MNSTKPNNPNKTTKTICHIRWMIRRDMKSVLEIEKQSFPDPWTEQEFLQHLRQRYTIGMVAEINDEVVGYMLYELHPRRIALLNLSVDPKYRLSGIGSQLVSKLIGKLEYQRRSRIEAFVLETNLPAQLMFRACGFRAEAIDQATDEDDTEETFYLFRYRFKKES